jgi:hypothetical protein
MDERSTQLREQMQGGKLVLFAPRSVAAASTLARLLGQESVTLEEAKPDKYAMLAEVDFQHPLFAAFADPRFSDFTKIHSGSQRIDATAIPGTRVVARFDSGAPALLEVLVGGLLVLTSRLAAEDSQFALSSKFVPLLLAARTHRRPDHRSLAIPRRRPGAANWSFHRRGDVALA